MQKGWAHGILALSRRTGHTSLVELERDRQRRLGCRGVPLGTLIDKIILSGTRQGHSSYSNSGAGLVVLISLGNADAILYPWYMAHILVNAVHFVLADVFIIGFSLVSFQADRVNIYSDSDRFPVCIHWKEPDTIFTFPVFSSECNDSLQPTTHTSPERGRKEKEVKLC